MSDCDVEEITWTTKSRKPFAAARSGESRATHSRMVKNAWRSPLSSPDGLVCGTASSVLPVRCWPSHLPSGGPPCLVCDHCVVAEFGTRVVRARLDSPAVELGDTAAPAPAGVRPLLAEHGAQRTE